MTPEQLAVAIELALHRAADARRRQDGNATANQIGEALRDVAMQLRLECENILTEITLGK